MADSKPSSHDRDKDELTRVLTERAGRLFALRSKHDGRDYSDKEWAGLIRKETGEKVSHTWVWEVRTGRLTNTTLRHVGILARFFGAPPKYFIDLDEEAAERVEAELDLVAEVRKAGIQSIAAFGATSTGLAGAVSPETITAITEMLRSARQAKEAGETQRGTTPPPELEG